VVVAGALAGLCVGTAGVGCGIGVAMIAGAASGLSGYVATEVANGRKPTINSALKATAIGGITGAAGGALATGGSALIKAITNKIKPGGAPGATGTGSSALDDLGRPTTAGKTNTNGNTYGQSGFPKASPIAQRIANGHGFAKHSIEYPPGLTRDGYARIIDDVINTGEMKILKDGRSAFWKDPTVVIKNPLDPDGGTAFIPTNGRSYFDNTLK
jgi:filamentous hemagglutinin